MSPKNRVLDVSKSTAPSKWIASPRFPVTSRLRKLYEDRPKRVRVARNTNLRPNVVSEKLCEDTLRRLAPTLQSYRGCDVVDINPGTCIWSSKLHEFLRPRRHLLVEPDGRTYQSFLDPLVNVASSAYHHVPIDTDNFDNLEKIITGHHLPEQEEQEPIGQSSTKINHTLLVTANLSSNAVDGDDINRWVNIALHRNHVFNRSYLKRSHLNKWGLVRMLLWMPHLPAGKAIPKGILDRAKASTLFDISSRVALVTCPQMSIDSDPRRLPLHLESRQKVASLMASNDTYDPEDRRSHSRDPNIFELGPEEDELESAIQNMKNVPDWVRELTSLRSTMLSKGISISGARKPPHGTDVAEVKRYGLLQSKFKKLKMFYKRTERLIDEYLETYDKHELDKVPGSNGSQPHNIVQDRMAKLQEVLDRLPAQSRNEVYVGADDRSVFHQSPPGLQWDRRQNEPLINVPDEFYPQEPLCLIDFEPSTDSLARIDTSEKYAYVLTFITLVFRSVTKTLSEILEDIAPDGSEYLLERVPELSERFHVDKVRVRAVPSHMLLDLALAWYEWPFKPPYQEVLLNLPLGDQVASS